MILEQSQRHGAKIDEAKKENLVQFFIPTSNELCFDDFVFPGVKCLKVYIDHTVILSARLEYHLADLRLHLAMMCQYDESSHMCFLRIGCVYGLYWLSLTVNSCIKIKHIVG